MALKLIYITNNEDVALIAEKYGVDRIMVDLETLGKEERQKNMNTVKSHHTVDDAKKIAARLKTSELLVRINPWHDGSLAEIESVIKAGAKRIMLPMWKSKKEVDMFLNAVNRRAKTTLLLETKEAVECLDEVLENPLIDDIHIGLNDLHLSYKLDFMFELLANGTVEKICSKIKAKGKPYGFGGIGKIGEGMLPAEKIVMEHYRLGSSMAILSRSFCNTQEITDLNKIDEIFSTNLKNLRLYEKSLSEKKIEEYQENTQSVIETVNDIVKKVKEKKRNE